MGSTTLRYHLVLWALISVGVANYLDRFILSIVLPLIRAEFQLSDFSLGLLAGPSFAVVDAVLGVPLGLMADRFGRRTMIVGCLTVFTSATFVCGLAGTFPQLLVARFATAVGEAGITPSVNALICDLCPPERRAGALSLYAASSNIGLVLALLGGGWIAERGGWRMAFFVSAGFGLLVFAALSAVLRTPRHDRRAGVAGVRLRTTLAVLWAQPVFRWVVVGTAIASVGGYAAAAFVPSFLARSHHLTPAAIGLALARLSGTFGWAGTALPGLIADRWGHGDVAIGLKIASVALVAALPFQPVFYWRPVWVRRSWPPFRRPWPWRPSSDRASP